MSRTKELFDLVDKLKQATINNDREFKELVLEALIYIIENKT